MEMRPMDIEKRSMAIIESELQVELPEEIRPIVLRVIHTTVDFSFAESLFFSPGVVCLMRDMLKNGASIITDTQMAASGINKAATETLGVSVKCFMADADVAEQAKSRGVTRALVSIERALSLDGPKILVCGNAPTFLMGLVRAHGIMPVTDIAVVGVPVGFVNVVEAKEQVRDSGLPAILSMGRRGGSNVAAAIVNALMYGIEGVR